MSASDHVEPTTLPDNDGDEGDHERDPDSDAKANLNAHSQSFIDISTHRNLELDTDHSSQSFPIPSASSSTSNVNATPPDLPQQISLLLPLPNHPLFKSTQLGTDRRLLINRKRKLKMYRVWVQGVFEKL